VSDGGFQVVADAAAHWATTVGVVFGGAWAWYRFGLTRQRQAALSMKLACKCEPHGGSGNFFAALCATIKNTGTVKLEIRRARAPAYPRESEDNEILQYGGDLLVRRVDESLKGSTPVRWFADSNARSPRPEDIELDLLSSYEQDEETSFWMEPGETYQLGTAVVLSRGTYIVMLTILGEDSDKDFWRSEFILVIPAMSGSADCVLTPQGSG
jgi:hypothetical protein